MPRILISYRRSDAAGVAGRIFDKLAHHFGASNLFMDIDNIPLGVDFRDHIATVFAEGDVLLALIGRDWLGPRPDGSRRIDQPSDMVRIEVEAALQRNIPVIPILIDRAPMPTPAELPASMEPLAYRNAADLDSFRDFHPHMDRVIRSMERLLEWRKSQPDLAERTFVAEQVPVQGSPSMGAEDPAAAPGHLPVQDDPLPVQDDPLPSAAQIPAAEREGGPAARFLDVPPSDAVAKAQGPQVEAAESEDKKGVTAASNPVAEVDPERTDEAIPVARSSAQTESTPPRDAEKVPAVSRLTALIRRAHEALGTPAIDNDQGAPPARSARTAQPDGPDAEPTRPALVSPAEEGSDVAPGADRNSAADAPYPFVGPESARPVPPARQAADPAGRPPGRGDGAEAAGNGEGTATNGSALPAMGFRATDPQLLDLSSEIATIARRNATKAIWRPLRGARNLLAIALAAGALGQIYLLLNFNTAYSIAALVAIFSGIFIYVCLCNWQWRAVSNLRVLGRHPKYTPIESIVSYFLIVPKIQAADALRDMLDLSTPAANRRQNITGNKIISKFWAATFYLYVVMTAIFSLYSFRTIFPLGVFSSIAASVLLWWIVATITRRQRECHESADFNHKIREEAPNFPIRVDYLLTRTSINFYSLLSAAFLQILISAFFILVQYSLFISILKDFRVIANPTYINQDYIISYEILSLISLFSVIAVIGSMAAWQGRCAEILEVIGIQLNFNAAKSAGSYFHLIKSPLGPGKAVGELGWKYARRGRTRWRVLSQSWWLLQLGTVVILVSASTIGLKVSPYLIAIANTLGCVAAFLLFVIVLKIGGQQRRMSGWLRQMEGLGEGPLQGHLGVSAAPYSAASALTGS